MSVRSAVHQSKLRPVSGSRLRGFRPIYQKELAYWFGTYRWISQLLIWMSLTAVPAIWMTPNSTQDRGVSYLTLFLWLSSALVPIGMIVLAQGTIIEEKLTQTLLWICSKPLSRAALILAKFAAYAVLMGGIALGLPAVLVYIAATIAGLPNISLLNYFVAVCLLYLGLLFTLALTLMLGTFFNRIGPVTAIALFVFFGGTGINASPELRRIEPYSVWALSRHAVATVVGQFPNEAWIAVSSTIILTVLCLVVAVWQMRRYEL